jgi:2-iminobutanoate/2-iminopropanoate deaminase
MTEVIATSGAPAPGGAYSQAVRSGNTIWLAGQVGVDPSTGDVADGVAGQTRQALRNLEAVLSAAGGSLSNLVKTTCFLTDVAAFAEFNAVYSEVMGDHRPPRSTVGVELAGGYLVEIEGVAVIE